MSRRLDAVIGWVGALGLVFSLWSSARFAADLRTVLAAGGSGADSRQARWDVDEEKPPIASDVEGGAWRSGRWTLPQGGAGRLTLRYKTGSASPARTAVWVRDVGRVRAWWSAGGRREEIPSKDWRGSALLLPPSDEVDLIVEASQDLPGEQVVFERALFSCPAAPLPSPAPLLCLMVFSLLALWPLFHRREGGPRDWLALAAAAGCMAVAFHVRWGAFDLTRALAVEPDASGYMQYADSLRWFTRDHGFYSASFSEREPLFIAVLNLWFKAWGPGAASARWMTVALSVLLTGATGLFLWGATGRRWAATAALMMAVHPEWIDLSVRALREELMTLLTLAALWTWLRARGKAGSVALGAVTGAAALVRWTSLAVFPPFYWGVWAVNGFAARTKFPRLFPLHWRWRELAGASAVTLLLCLPHSCAMGRVHGDAAWPLRGYARWNANKEFPEKWGTPGFPSVEEATKSLYAGPRISYGDYMWGLHTPGTLVRGQVRGWLASSAFMAASWRADFRGIVAELRDGGWRVLLRRSAWPGVLAAVATLFLTAIGWAAFLGRPEDRWIPLFAFWGTWPVAYLYSVRLVEVFRHTCYVYPLWLLCLVEGSRRLARAVWKARGAGKAIS